MITIHDFIFQKCGSTEESIHLKQFHNVAKLAPP